MPMIGNRQGATMQDDNSGRNIATLDPADWRGMREQGHRMLDDMFDYLEDLRNRPVWQPIPDRVRQRFSDNLPRQPGSLEQAHQTFMDDILPYAAGNAHPGFMGWVQGGGTPVGMLAEMLAAGLNANVGGRDQIPLEVERQITHWRLGRQPDRHPGRAEKNAGPRGARPGRRRR
jgi:hypothetical protein